MIELMLKQGSIVGSSAPLQADHQRFRKLFLPISMTNPDEADRWQDAISRGFRIDPHVHDWVKRFAMRSLVSLGWKSVAVKRLIVPPQGWSGCRGAGNQPLSIHDERG